MWQHYYFCCYSTIYIQAKIEYDAALFDIERNNKSLDTIIQTRDLSYRGFVVESIQSHAPAAAIVKDGADINEADKDAVNKAHITASYTEGDSQFSATASTSSVSSATCAGNIDVSEAAAGVEPVVTPLRTVRVRRDSFVEAQQAAAQATASAASAASSAGEWVSSKFSGNINYLRMLMILCYMHLLVPVDPSKCHIYLCAYLFVFI